MGIKEWLKKLMIEKGGAPIPVAEPVPVVLSEKDAATAKGEPWVNVMSVNLDMDNVGNGSFDLDWNKIFVARLVKAGYKGKDDITIVDQWFATICRNVLEENYEQGMADPTNRAEFNSQLRNSTKK